MCPLDWKEFTSINWDNFSDSESSLPNYSTYLKSSERKKPRMEDSVSVKPELTCEESTNLSSYSFMLDSDEDDLQVTAVYTPPPQGVVEIREAFNDEAIGCLMTKSPLYFKKISMIAQAKNVTLKEANCSEIVAEGLYSAVNEVMCEIRQCYLRLKTESNEITHTQMILPSFYGPVCSEKRTSEWKEQLMETYTTWSEISLVCCDKNSSSSVLLKVGKDHAVQINVGQGKLHEEKTDAIVLPTGRSSSDDIRHYPIQLPYLKSEYFQSHGKRGYLWNSQRLVEVGEVEVMEATATILSCSYIIHTLYPQEKIEFFGWSKSDFFSNVFIVAPCHGISSISFPGVGTTMILPLLSSLKQHGSSLQSVNILVGTKDQAEAYSKVLKEVTAPSSLGTRNRKSCSSSRKSVFYWFWRDEFDVLTPYNEEAAKLLNHAYCQDPKVSCTLTIDSKQYLVDFKMMTQTNLSSSKKREVTKWRKNSDQDSITWKYKNDSEQYSAYSPDKSLQIEYMYQHQGSSHNNYLVIDSRIYELDFEAMVQRNAGFSRNIMRDTRSPKSDDICPTFLTEGEVMISLKGPPKKISSAQSYLKKSMEKQLKTCMIHVPDPLPSVLKDKLKAIAEIHQLVNSKFITNQSQKIMQLKGEESLVKVAQDELKNAVTSYAINSKYPDYWEPMKSGEQLKLVLLSRESHEFRTIYDSFKKTMIDFEVIDIQRIQNKWIWERYAMTKCRMHKKNSGKINERKLFHGSRNARAECIYSSEEGFDMRFSIEGMWGHANYFAEKAVYSDFYAFHSEGIKEMMVALVLTGDTYKCGPDSNLRMPPEKPNQEVRNGSKLCQRYDSVCGITKKCTVYMTYCNDNAYPAYVIKYHPRVGPADPTLTPSSQSWICPNSSTPPQPSTPPQRLSTPPWPSAPIRPSAPPQPSSPPQRPSIPSWPSTLPRPSTPPQPSAPPQPSSTPQQPSIPSWPSTLPRPSTPPQPSAPPQRPSIPSWPSTLPRPSIPPRPSTPPQPSAPPRQPSTPLWPSIPPQSNASSQSSSLHYPIASPQLSAFEPPPAQETGSLCTIL